MSSATTRRSFLAGAAAAAGHGFQPGARRPNILWIVAEDLSPDLGCYGNGLVRTPNLDRLASEGVRFTRAFVTAPVCSASRSAIVTGMYQTTVGGHNHRSHRDDNYRLPAGVRPFTHFLREAGYHTSNLERVAGLGGTGKTDFNFQVENVFEGKDWRERKPGQPFYAQINFEETHRAFKRFPAHPVDPAKVELPPCYPDHPAIRLDWATYLDDAQHLDVNVGKTLKRLDEDGLADDTVVIFFGDHGQAMPRGKQFLYDAGIHVPLLVRIPKTYAPAGYAPGTVNADLVSAIDITATTLRLAGVQPPPYMEGRPFFGPGVRKRDYIVAARDRCDETVDRIRCVRDRRYKYIRNFYPDRPYAQPNVYKDVQYPPLRVMRDLKTKGKLTGPAAAFLAATRPAEELYDLEADPREIDNLAEKPAGREPIARLRGILDAWIKETGDQGAIPEKGRMEWDKYRAEVDGWCSQTNCRVSKIAGGMKVDCFGKRAEISRSCVAPGGDLLFEFRARSTAVAPPALRWGTIENMAGAGLGAGVSFQADGTWQERSIPFRADGYLGKLTLELGDAEGAIEFDWIRVSRKGGGAVQQWDFA
ncbi:MAG: sulfatase [Bryobacteraceae bacterium]|nr:sulfatase [Bryobacteraceae bacterium]